MISLKAFSEELAPLLGLSAAALYERQRALVRLGALPEPVKGRGHGLLATPSTVATLVLAVMATDNLSDTDDRVSRLARARAIEKKCAITGKSMFVDALAAVLGDPDLASTVSRIRVFRSDMVAVIRMFPTVGTPILRQGRDPLSSKFGRARENLDRLEVEASLSNPVICKIAQLLHPSERSE